MAAKVMEETLKAWELVGLRPYFVFDGESLAPFIFFASPIPLIGISDMTIQAHARNQNTKPY